ncbi:TPA: methionine adenosyltransferase [Patescibacteria group bacterium]|uniref:Methionine adenosyltransferase n=1 Tax=candidate division Kazan bacterium GW2011_GWA1_44_22 TaxID=1620410 RepID=A0A0G1I0B4_UNCK3|nr:MAG: S-adenosylmethionine synthase [candidate division Kazan bacterium GW2011_GWA1_44_22]HCR41845.1 methionine adenosyltransferase [Patescibacteria group bacterium]
MTEHSEGMSDMGMRMSGIMTTEFVSPGHPDKVCDQIADAIVDKALSHDPKSRVAMEVTGGHYGLVVIGEITTAEQFDIAKVVKEIYKSIGHNDHDLGVFVNVVSQASDIARGVDIGGAGDQGVMTGYAVRNPEGNHMPPVYMMARALTQKMTDLRCTGTTCLRPDGKSQVVMMDGKVTHVILAAHHAADISTDDLRQLLLEQVIRQVVPATDPVMVNPVLFDQAIYLTDGISGNVVINGTGAFIQGGFNADAGTTGRKLIVDNYGPNVEIGGGCYSGKDPTKVDRSAAYFCRFVAKSIVAGGLATEALVKVGYAIGVPTPSFVTVQTPLLLEENSKLQAHILEKFDFRPAAIIERFGLQRPVGWCYRETAAAGHYTDPKFPWEKTVDI